MMLTILLNLKINNVLLMVFKKVKSQIVMLITCKDFQRLC